MKKRLIIFAYIVGITISAKAYDFEVDGIYYDSLSAKTCEVVSGNGYFLECIKIPTTVSFAGNDYKVVRIGAGAFYNQTSVKSVHIPVSLTAIGSESFMHCYGLTSIEVDNGNPAYSSYEGALYDKSRSRLIFVPAGKTEYKILSGIKEISKDAFYLCKSLRKISIPNGVSHIGDNAFAGCDSLVSIDIPNSVEYIGEYAFCGCKSLTTLTVPSSVTMLGRSAFSFCTSLKAVAFTMGKVGIQSIPGHLFNGCTSLETVIIPMGITSLGDYSFAQCDSLRAIQIPSTVTTLGNNVFYNCHSLKNFEFPENIETIGSQAFEYCQQLDTIALPRTLNEIGENAFNGCRGLTYFRVSEDNIKYKSFKGKLYDYQMDRLIKVPAKATKDSIPSSVTHISAYAYFLCCFLDKVVVPEPLTDIGKWAFVGCSSLDSVYMSKPINLSETYLPQDTRVLFVPIGKKKDFEGSSYYSDQYSLFKAIKEYGDTPTIMRLQMFEKKYKDKPVIYNLQGIRIGDRKYLSKGIYVINGQKVFCK